MSEVTKRHTRRRKFLGKQLELYTERQTLVLGHPLGLYRAPGNSPGYSASLTNIFIYLALPMKIMVN